MVRKIAHLVAKVAATTILLVATVPLIGCNTYDPTKLTEQQMTDEILTTWKSEGAESAQMKKVEGGFEGTVKLKGGETLQVKVTNDPATKSARIVGKGDRGTENLEYTLRAVSK